MAGENVSVNPEAAGQVVKTGHTGKAELQDMIRCEGERQ